LILFIDEIHIFPFLEGLNPLLDDIGFSERILPGLRQFHISCFHHWMFGVLLILSSGVGLIITFKKIDGY